MKRKQYKKPIVTTVTVMVESLLGSESLTMSSETKVTNYSQVFSRSQNGSWDDED